MSKELKIHFHVARSKEGQKAFAELKKIYGQTTPEKADIIIPLGGDGTMLEALHKFHKLKKPIYGMNRGSVGFLLNPYRVKNLAARLKAAQKVTLHPLRMTAKNTKGEVFEAIAFNEVSLFRETRMAAKVAISVDGVRRLKELVCDGVLLATPAGSTAYNLSAHGSIIPLSANVLGLTPISAFRPRRWRGALLPHKAEVRFDVCEADKRPVSVAADQRQVRNAVSVEIRESRSISVTLLFDPDHNLEERILKEQFLP